HRVRPAPELPICAQATRTERAHRTSPGGLGRRVQIGTYALALDGTERRFCAPVDWRLSRRSVRLRDEHASPERAICAGYLAATAGGTEAAGSVTVNVRGGRGRGS